VSLIFMDECQLVASLLRVSLGIHDFAAPSTGKKKNCNPAKSHFCTGKKGIGSCVPLTKKCAIPVTGVALQAATTISAQKPSGQPKKNQSSAGAGKKPPKSPVKLDAKTNDDWKDLAQFGVTAPPNQPIKLLNNNPTGSHDTIPVGYAARDKHFEKYATADHSGSEMSQALKDFSSLDYEGIREFERTGKESELSFGNDEKHAKAINAYIAQAPKYKGEVHRGLSLPDQPAVSEFLKKMTAEGGFELDAMSSFSSDPTTAREFDGGKYGVILKVKANQSGTSIKNISNHKDEDEVLVPKGAKYRVAGKPRLINYPGRVLIEIDMEEIE
jgi:hypothetical protein